jgi:hypothetical protein
VFGVLSLTTAAGCVQPVGPARSFDDYEHKAKDTAETVLSSVETARLAAVASGDGDVIPPFVSVLLGDVEHDATGAQSTFDGIQPPDRSSDELRAELEPLLVRATGLLADARIAARRADLEAVARLRGRLARTGDRLRAFVEEHE